MVLYYGQMLLGSPVLAPFFKNVLNKEFAKVMDRLGSVEKAVFVMHNGLLDDRVGFFLWVDVVRLLGGLIC